MYKERERERERERGVYSNTRMDQDGSNHAVFPSGLDVMSNFLFWLKKMKILRIKTTWDSADHKYISVWTTQYNLFFHVYSFPFTLEDKLG